VALTLVAEEPEDNDWLKEEMMWSSQILFDLGYVETKEEWEDFMDYMCDNAAAWMLDQVDKNE